MDVKQAASKIKAYLLPFFDRNKTIEEIGESIRASQQAPLVLIWDEMKSRFVIEYEENTPIDTHFDESDMEAYIKSKLKKLDDVIKKKIDDALKEIEAKGQQTNSGDYVAGDKKVYNIKHINTAKFS